MVIELDCCVGSSSADVSDAVRDANLSSVKIYLHYLLVLVLVNCG